MTDLFTDKEFDLFGDRLEEMEDLANDDDLKKSNHGGLRSGAGRKKESPTKQIRIDSDLAHIFKTLSNVYRDSNEESKLRFVKHLTDFE